MTFGEFDELLNRWIVETIEMNKVYFHQCDDVQWMFFKVKFNLSKVSRPNGLEIITVEIKLFRSLP